MNKKSSTRKLHIFGHQIPTFVTESYKQVGVFGFGAAVSQLTTDIAKYTIGRLRPHFIAVSIFFYKFNNNLFFFCVQFWQCYKTGPYISNAKTFCT